MRHIYWVLFVASFVCTPGCSCHVVIHDTTSFIGHKYTQCKIVATYTDGEKYFVVVNNSVDKSKTLDVSKEMFDMINLDKDKVYEFTTDDKSVLTYKVVEE